MVKLRDTLIPLMALASHWCGAHAIWPQSAPTTADNMSVSASFGEIDRLFKRQAKRFWGNSADYNTLNIAVNAAILKSEFGQVTPANSMKWDGTEPSRGNFYFGGADYLVNWAASNGKLVRGSYLVWHSQLPRWVSNINDTTTLTSVIQDHISQVAGRYRGKLDEWIVCNEVLKEDGSGLRSSVFSNVLGESFITIAFSAARAADPTARLYINDYNLDSNNTKTRGMVKLVNRINASQRYIDGIGTQMHLGAGGASGASSAFSVLASTGLELAITELDIENSAHQVDDYLTVLYACLDTPSCVSITSSDVSDIASWRSAVTPCLFSVNYQPKPAYSALVSALNALPAKTTDGAKPTPTAKANFSTLPEITTPPSLH
ncbi:glycoside hydrolase superfamily [Panaeolus papilionaceus]|nr:glycoside hydrolase superfamily [Panaeolus papilionaceus]